MSFVAEKVRKGLKAIIDAVKKPFAAQRLYPPELSRRQIEEEVPVSWKADNVLWGYVTKYLLKGSGAGFVTPPYTAYWERLWGTQPIEDLPKYKDLYTFTPYIKASIDVTVNLAISNGFELEGGEDNVREWLNDWLDEQNILETLRIIATDMLVFGNAYLEMCRNEETGKIEWLKPLDPCFVAGTYVILKDGTIKMIEDVKMNDYVITHQGRAQKVTETFEREINEEIIKIKLGKFSEPIWVTGNHPILAIKCEDWNRYLYRVRNFRKELKRFKDGKRKKLPVHNIKVPAPQWIEAGKLRKGDIVVYTLNQEIAKGNLKNLRVGDYVSPLKRLHSNYHDISEKIIDVDEDFGELLGWYLAEGSTSRDGIQFSLSKDEEHTALKLLKIIEEKFGVKGSYSFGNKNDISVTINSKQLKEFFEYHCGKHADEKRISNEIIEGASINVLKALLLAYVKGDGFVRKIRSKGTLYSCTSQSLSLTNQLKEIILHLGRVPRLSVDKPGKSGFKSSKPCYTLRWIDGTTRTLSKVDEKYAYIRVQKVERVHYKGKVYNLAVEEDESYNVNYFTAHNCHMRVRRDAYGQVLGYIQLLTFPPVVFASDEICHFKWGAKSWWYECFPEGTIIYMEHGIKPIEKMKIGDDVVTHLGRHGKVEAVKSFDYDGDLIEITTYHNNIPVLATPTHPFYASIRKRGTKRKEHLPPTFVLAKDLAVKDYLLIPINREVVNIEQMQIEANKKGYGKTVKIDEDFMRLCGYYIADGSKNNNHSFYIVFNKGEETFAEDAKQIVERNGIHAFIRDKGNKIYVRITSTALTKFMEQNFGRGAKNKHIPKWIMLLPPEKQRGLIEGLIRGDGYRDEKRYSIATVSESLAYQIFHLLLRQNFIPSLHRRRTRPAKLKDGRIIHSSQFIYTIMVYNRRDWSKGWGYAKGKIVGNYAYLPIRKIRRIHHCGKIWNLDINEDETFCVGIGYAVHNSAYGTSLLRPLLKIQALIDQLEDDMAVIVHTYAKPMLVVKAGTPERPWTDQQLQQLVEAFRDRKPATDVFVRGDVDVEVVPSLTKDVNVTFWLDYLLRQREAVLGVPKIFLGYSEGTNRATAEIIMQEYVTRLRMMQEIIGDTLETVLFKQLIRDEFGEGVEVPKVKWKPLWEPPLADKAKYLCDLVDKGIILPKEARTRLGFPEEYPISTPEELQAILKRNGVKP